MLGGQATSDPCFKTKCSPEKPPIPHSIYEVNGLDTVSGIELLLHDRATYAAVAAKISYREALVKPDNIKEMPTVKLKTM